MKNGGQDGSDFTKAASYFELRSEAEGCGTRRDDFYRRADGNDRRRADHAGG